MRRHPVFALSAILTVALESPAAHADTLETIARRGEVVFGADAQGGEPYVFEDPSDPARGLIGFEVDIANALGLRLGWKARFLQADWSTLVPSLERGDFDVALNGLEDTPSRRARVLLSEPYFSFGETLAVKKGSSRAALETLAGARIGTLNQSFGYEVLRTRGFDPVLYEGVSEPYADLELGRISGVLLDHVIADRYGCTRTGVTCVPGDVARGTYVAAVRGSDATLLRRLNDALSAMRRDGQLRLILEKWNLWDFRQIELSHRLETSTEDGPTPPPSAAPRRWSYADTRLFLRGAVVTLLLSLAAFLLALPLGLGLALARLERSGPLRGLAAAYVEVFRGTPLLLQLYVLYFGLAPILKLDPVVAAVVALALNYAAYEAEIHRGALLAIPRGQGEAAQALGMNRLQVLRYVLLPQSFRIALPSMTNDFVALLKDSSLVSVITVVELTKRMTIAAVDLRGWLVPGLACAALYFGMSYPLARLAARLEERLRRDRHPPSP